MMNFGKIIEFGFIPEGANRFLPCISEYPKFILPTVEDYTSTELGVTEGCFVLIQENYPIRGLNVAGNRKWKIRYEGVELQDDEYTRVWNFRQVVEYITDYCQKYKYTKVIAEKWRTPVYLIHSDLGIKIGKSKDPFRRFREMNTYFPFKASIRRVYWNVDGDAFEGSLHRKFDHKRIRGEWFRLSDIDLMKIDLAYVFHSGPPPYRYDHILKSSDGDIKEMYKDFLRCIKPIRYKTEEV